METKKGVFQQHQNQPQMQQVLGGVDYNNEPLQSKPTLHQHNTAPPHHLRLLQYGLKIPNHQHHQLNQHQQQTALLPQSQQQHHQYYTHSQYNVLPPSVYQHVHQSQHQPPPGIHLYQNSPSPLEHPQIWMPPLHYHQPQPKAEQPQQLSVIKQNTSSELNQMPKSNQQSTLQQQQQKTSSKEVAEKKKSAGSGVHHQLRSPIAKRPLEAPVTMQGWLHKQGSEGLMLWKKRWFVLCDYCLFYYKGPEEEKLLGSILMPSYKVSVCSPEDKVYRKFAFKSEHANMRTYILAADSQELMFQWIRVLNMACLLQNNNESDKQSGQSVSSLYNQSADNSDSGFHQQYPHQLQQQQQRNTPIHAHSSSNTTDTTNQELNQYNQPLYANAPPKPRRLTDGGYSSPSPDDTHRYILLHDQNPKYMNPIYVSRAGCKSPVNVCLSQNGAAVQYGQYPPTRDNLAPQAERRTPDTYGRSKLNPIKMRSAADYEDVYGAEQAMYKRPLSPVAYTNIKKTNPPIQRAYNPVYMDVQMRKQHNSIPRPHSADFLEYEVKHPQEAPNGSGGGLGAQRPARPKSSLDINRHSPNDSYFYSEERYAEKMRKSAQYFAPNVNTTKYYGTNLHQEYHNQRHKYLENERLEGGGTFPLTRSNTQPISFENAAALAEYSNRNPNPNAMPTQPVRSRSVLSEGSLTKELYMDCRTNARDREREREQMVSPVSRHQMAYMPEDLFTRSASARLARGNLINERQMHEERVGNARDGERKREESMKRLLEWKQRMLQSPLNRKLCSNVRGKAADGRRSVPHYNSYSSDDEDYEDRSRKRAGRTMENVSSPIPALSASTTVFNLAEPSSVLNDKDSDSNQLTKPLKITNNQLLNTAHISSLRSEYSDQFQDTPVITEIKSNGALVKSILAEFEKKPTTTDTTTSTIATITTTTSPATTASATTTIFEENYMSMTPKISILDPTIHDIEESSYVEMTQGVSNLALLNLNNELQPYELVCFSEGKMEPVYMELCPSANILDTADSNKNELPDILNESSNKSSKSDSSDAEEVSKDFTPRRPGNRFSLSDTFRPASYYLGATRVLPEFHDSSDSELVSPPPIPTSPPPTDDFEHLDDSFDQNKREITSKLQSEKKDEDSSSLFSINTDDSVELRLSNSVNSNYERMMKRRPVSEDFYDELESLDSRFNETIDSIDLDKYLKELEVTTMSNGNENSFHDYENLCIMNKTEEKANECLSTPARETIARATSSLSNPMQNVTPISYVTPPLISAPYYYSDLSVNMSNQMEEEEEDDEDNLTMLTLNNQRSAMNVANKRDIMHIVNPIGDNRSTFKLAAEARSVSVDFLNLTDKSGHIDKKNIYESDTLKRLKAIDSSTTSSVSNMQMLNVYPLSFSTNKMFLLDEGAGDESVRRSHSLEGLLENVLSSETPESTETVVPQSDTSSWRNVATDLSSNTATEGSHVWEEDSIWREQLRRVSQRHTKSLDDLLDTIVSEKQDEDTSEKNPNPKRSKAIRSIIRGATYVNDSVCNASKMKEDKEDANKLEKDKEDKEKSEQQQQQQQQNNSFILDREKLRQWDLLSSAPSDENGGIRFVSTVVESDAGVGLHTTCQPNTQTLPASGSISLNRDTFPRMINDKKMWTPQMNLPPQQSRSDVNIARQENNYMMSNRGSQQKYYMSHSPSSHHNLLAEQYGIQRKAGWQWNGRNFSAGELLGRTHEELVLLLIQLRRQSTNTCHAIESCYAEIDNIQSQLNMMDAAKRLENLQKLDQIKQHLLELEKQYEKGKPLVNLVDNMVKLGSLYRSPPDRSYNPYVRDRLEFNQQIQEKRLLAEERRDWNRLSPNHTQFQAKVQQLYQLDRLIHEESGTLQGLQQDKEEIERALDGLRQRLNRGNNDPVELEQARKQQAILENELSKVHQMLAQNSKKLEQTVAGNARLEQELRVLKQKLQISRQPRSSPQFSNPCDSLPCVVGTSAMLESDLQRVQQKVGDLQRQRQELSIQVRQLTDKSLQHQLRPTSITPVHANQGSTNNKKKMPALWRETDLDTMNIIDHGNHYGEGPPPTIPLYINTDLKQGSDSDYYGRGMKMSSDSTSDDMMQMLPQEKQEIKTVRIVKRESERRQRDREKTGQVKWDAVLEEDDNYFMQNKLQNINSEEEILIDNNANASLDNSVYSDLPTTSTDNASMDKSPELSPIFKSEAARQIINEMSINQSMPSQSSPSQSSNLAVIVNKNNSSSNCSGSGGRRIVPKEKRRHYTAPHNNLIMKSLNQLPTDDSAFDRMILNSRRARDDLDMERALRQRIDAPDVVRSTLSSKELKYNENTIDNLLGTPNKISIPERYIPEKLPQLSAEEQQHRLRKVESIKKMLSDTTIISGSSVNLASTSSTDDASLDRPTSSLVNKATSKMMEEKRQREHLLQLNQILAKQVMEMSKIVAVKALATLPLDKDKMSNAEDDDLSPDTPLPIYQQRDNFYS